MIISDDNELKKMKAVSQAVAVTLLKMQQFARPGISTQELDEFGGDILREFGARSAPRLTYGFPGYTCISLNNEVAHGIPSPGRILQDGDLINIDVSAELDGYWSDNGGSIVVGEDLHGHTPLVDASKIFSYLLYPVLKEESGSTKLVITLKLKLEKEDIWSSKIWEVMA